ncbi:hypothetical protein NL676_006847 [Syzygium grande]|nr:hypothetical protein NL676_006847 [Syzygium grande]
MATFTESSLLLLKSRRAEQKFANQRGFSHIPRPFKPSRGTRSNGAEPETENLITRAPRETHAPNEPPAVKSRERRDPNDLCYRCWRTAGEGRSRYWLEEGGRGGGDSVGVPGPTRGGAGGAPGVGARAT